MPAPLRRHRGRAVVLDRDNIDTDQIIPSREMKRVSQDGLADGLFAGWRYLDVDSRTPDPEFVLNEAGDPSATILVSGENFGCGSSREHAVWALAEYGIRVVIARSFGEIFHGNCLRNGLLPIALSGADMQDLLEAGTLLTMTVDLPSQTLACDELPDWEVSFDIDAYPKRLLLEGLDPIALTLQQDAQINDFLDQDRSQRPWVYSAD